MKGLTNSEINYSSTWIDIKVKPLPKMSSQSPHLFLLFATVVSPSAAAVSVVLEAKERRGEAAFLPFFPSIYNGCSPLILPLG